MNIVVKVSWIFDDWKKEFDKREQMFVMNQAQQ